jgi:hypothetical protein
VVSHFGYPEWPAELRARQTAFQWITRLESWQVSEAPVEAQQRNSGSNGANPITISIDTAGGFFVLMECYPIHD